MGWTENQGESRERKVEEDREGRLEHSLRSYQSVWLMGDWAEKKVMQLIDGRRYRRNCSFGPATPRSTNWGEVAKQDYEGKDRPFAPIKRCLCSPMKGRLFRWGSPQWGNLAVSEAKPLLIHQTVSLADPFIWVLREAHTSRRSGVASRGTLAATYGLSGHLDGGPAEGLLGAEQVREERAGQR